MSGFYDYTFPIVNTETAEICGYIVTNHIGPRVIKSAKKIMRVMNIGYSRKNPLFVLCNNIGDCNVKFFRNEMVFAYSMETNEFHMVL